MTKIERLKATVGGREDATGNVRPFVPRPQHDRRKANEVPADGPAGACVPVGDGDDPGPTAA